MRMEEEKKVAYSFKADLETRQSIADLAQVLSEKLGIKVSRGGAIKIAVREALKREKKEVMSI